MVAKNQYQDEFYLRIADGYRSGAGLAALEREFNVSRGTVYRAIRMHAVDERKPRLGEEKPAFDRFAPLPEVACCCGSCGLTFKRSIGQRTRRYAAACPNRPPAHGKKPTPKPLEAHQGRGRDAATVGRRRVAICQVCCNLAHARAVPVCADAWVTHSGRHIFAKGCGLPAEHTASLKDHDMVKRCGPFIPPKSED